MVGKLNSSYLKIIKVLNSKIQNKNTISNFFINLLKTKPIIPEQINNFEKYFTLIFDNIFADYWDLDRYEDSDYNVLNKSIIQILRINVISIIKIETINTISNYMVQITTSLKNDKIIDIGQIIKDIKSNNSLLESVDKYLYECLINKLEIKNPDKNTYMDLETQKKIIIDQLNLMTGINFDQDDIINLGKIIDFNKYLCENIGLNCLDEIKKILFDGKKMSIYYKINNVLNKN
jgi:hypothetical protein